MRLFFFILFVFCGSILTAKETLMTCDMLGGIHYLKFVNPIIGKNSIQEKIEGEWRNICGSDCVEIEVFKNAGRISEEINSTKTVDKNKIPGEGPFSRWVRLTEEGFPSGKDQEDVTRYYTVDKIFDFEFGFVKLKSFEFSDESRSKEIHKAEAQYTCKVMD